jgi:hypothetical protein
MEYLMKIPAVILLLMAGGFNCLSQTVVSPNYGLKSPLTAELVKVDFNVDATIVWMTIESDINNAWFCIERNTFLVKTDGSKLRLTGIRGLPHCPATYRFKRPGEKVSFSLTFPATGLLPWFSVIEECVGGCLSFRGVVTDARLNIKLNEAYGLSRQGEDMPAYRLFEEIIGETDSLNLGIEGSLFTTLIMLDRRMGRTESARKWYDTMMTADTPDLSLYLDNLKSQWVDY